MAKKKQKNKKQAQNRQRKREKRKSGRRGSGREAPARDVQKVLSLPEVDELVPYREVEAFATRTVEHLGKLVQLPDGMADLPNVSPYLKWYSLLRQIVTPKRLQSALQKLESARLIHERSAPVLNGLLMATRDEARGAITFMDNPLWFELTRRALRALPDDELLRKRMSSFLRKSEPRWLPLKVPVHGLRAVSGLEPERMSELRQIALSQDRVPGLGDSYDLLRAWAKLSLLLEAYTEEEGAELQARVLLEWARSYAERETFPEVQNFSQERNALEVVCCFLAERVNISKGRANALLQDPDGPDLALDLVGELSEDEPKQAYRIATWVAETYPEIFETHLELAKLSAALGDKAGSARHAVRARRELDAQGDDVDPRAREYFLEELRECLAGN